MPSRLEIEKLLQVDLDRAMVRYIKADAVFDSVIAGVPSGPPEPESVRLIREAGTAHTTALLGVNGARLRLNNLTIPGFLPDDFKVLDSEHDAPDA